MRLRGRTGLALAFPAGPVAGGRPAAAPSRIIDRTLLCETVVWAGVRKLTAYAQAGVRENASTWKSLAGAAVHTGGGVDKSLVGAAAGAPIPTEEQGLAIFPSSLWIGKQCQSTPARVAFSGRVLTGGTADPFGDTYECTVPRKLLVRVRAVFHSRASLLLDRRSGTRSTRSPVQTASIAVRTQSGKRLVFASALESGKARLFTAPSCTSP